MFEEIHGWDYKLEEKYDIDEELTKREIFAYNKAIEILQQKNLDQFYELDDFYVSYCDVSYGYDYLVLFHRDEKEDYYSDLHLKIPICFREDGSVYNNAQAYLITLLSASDILQKIKDEIERVEKIIQK